MKIFSFLCRKNRMPNGNIFIGKVRLVKEVKSFHKNRLMEDYRTEEKNMMYLRSPYLSREESHGHARALGIPETRLPMVLAASKRPFKPHVTLKERLGHLNTTYAWE